MRGMLGCDNSLSGVDTDWELNPSPYHQARRRVSTNLALLWVRCAELAVNVGPRLTWDAFKSPAQSVESNKCKQVVPSYLLLPLSLSLSHLSSPLGCEILEAVAALYTYN